MTFLVENNAVSRLSGGVTSSSTTIGVMAGDGAKFPSPAAGDWFPVALLKVDGALEIVKCTARTLDSLTVERAQEGTQALAFSAGDRIELRATKAVFNEIKAATKAADEKAGDAQTAAEAAQEGADASVKRTSASGAAILPGGPTEDRPDDIADGQLAVRLNTTTGKPEWYNHAKSEWLEIMDSGTMDVAALLGQVSDLSASQTVLEGQVSDLSARQAVLEGSLGHVIIYPNGGTGAAPANAAANSRYVSTNPYPGRKVRCVAEVLYNGVWAETGHFLVVLSGNFFAYFVKATLLGDSIITQVGFTGPLGRNNLSGGPHVVANDVTTPLPMRVHVYLEKE